MITQQNICSYYSKLLGTMSYNVCLGAMPTVSDDPRIPVCIMFSQKPLSVQDSDVYQYNVTFIFDVPLAGNGEGEMITAKRAILHATNKLVGIRDQNIKDDDGISYGATTELSISELSAARKDTGMIRGTFTVSGSLLISNGSLMFGKIKYYLDGHRLILTSASSHLEKGVRRDQDISSASDSYRLKELNRAHTYALNVLYQDTETERTLLRMIDGDQAADIELNKIYTLKIDYGAFSTSRAVKFISGDISGQQGAFLSYTVNFERVV